MSTAPGVMADPYMRSMKAISSAVIFVCAVLYGTVSTAAEEDDFWLLLDYDSTPQPLLQNSLWLYGGVDEFDGSYYGISAQLAIVEELHFIFSVTEQDYTVDTTDLRWGFGGPVNDNFSWSIQKLFWGKRDALEKNDTRLSLSFFYQYFNIQAAYEYGDLELFLKALPDIRQDSISSEHRAFELSAGYSWMAFYTQFSFKDHDFEKDLSLLATRRRLFLSINPIGIQQAAALADTEAGILFGLQHESMNYELFISRIRSAVSGNSNSYATLNLSKSFTSQLILGLDIELPVNDVPFSAGLSLGLLW